MTLLKRLGALFAGFVVIVAFLGFIAWHIHLPNFDWALNRTFIKFALNHPEMISQYHLPAGLTLYQDQLDDVSAAFGDKTITDLKAAMQELHHYDRASLSYQQKLSYEMADGFLEDLIALSERWRYHNYPVNQLWGVQTSFIALMEASHLVSSLTDARAYNIRLSKVGIKFEQLLLGLKAREQKGVIPPKFVVRKVIEGMNEFVEKPTEDNILYASFKIKLKKSSIDENEQRELLAETKTQIEQTVYPAYRLLIDYFAELESKANDEAGVWKLPDGDAFYAFTLRVFTTSRMPPAELHELGVQEVERVQAQMRAIFASEGYDVTKPIGTLMQELAAEDRFLYPDTDAGRAQILMDYQTIINQVSAGLTPWFNTMPKAKLNVEKVPEYKAKNSGRAYYSGGPLGGSEPGTFYVNVYDMKATPKFDMKTLAYHEGMPGHHMQYSIAQEQPDLPLFRRMGVFIAYVEGWALYVEHWAHEAGFENDPYDNLGRLQAELFRAVRLVVDTGIHSEHWSREQAIDYMRGKTGKSDSEVIAEVERYIVLPGQACAYTVGMLEIIKLREQAKLQLGDKFDIREFHDVILKNGPIPLATLNELVGEWIKQKLAETS